MNITVHPDRVYLNLNPDHHGERHRTAPGATAYLGKYGVTTEWDGRGGLLGIEVTPATRGEQISVDVGDLLASAITH